MLSVVKELSGFKGKACLVTDGARYWVVSSAFALFSGFETLVFAADENGRVTSYSDVAGGQGMTREEAIADLAQAITW